VREGACIGVATMSQPWTLRLTLKAAALAAASPTLLFSPLQNAWCLNQSASELLVCDDIQVLSPVAVKCDSVSRWACRKRRHKNCVTVCFITAGPSTMGFVFVTLHQGKTANIFIP
jgi:peptidoglycan biosynthesis protein MviN/MurJ (putative lipid II flippase)